MERAGRGGSTGVKAPVHASLLLGDRGVKVHGVLRHASECYDVDMLYKENTRLTSPVWGLLAC